MYPPNSKKESSSIKRNVWLILINSSEKYIFFAGLGLILLFITWIAFLWFWSIPEYQKIVSLAGTRFVIGRAGGVYFGYVLGLGYFENFVVNMFVDTVVVFILYPIFVLSHNLILEIKFLKNKIQYTFDIAGKSRIMIEKYGKIGLFLFVLFPMWGTGPVAGCAIGIIMGLNRWTNMAIVLGATYLAIICWAFLLTGFHKWILSYSSSAPLVIIIILFLTGIAAHILGRSRIRRRSKHVDEMVAMENDS